MGRHPNGFCHSSICFKYETEKYIVIAERIEYPQFANIKITCYLIIVIHNCFNIDFYGKDSDNS